MTKAKDASKMLAKMTPEEQEAFWKGSRAADDRREPYLRRKADRCGFRLSKSRRRDPHAVDYGLYLLTDAQTGRAINPTIRDRFFHTWTLDQVQDFLTTPDDERDAKLAVLAEKVRATY